MITQEVADRMIDAVKTYVAKALDARVGRLQAQLDAAEHRLERHSTHLKNLEMRMKSLER
jgi:CCR4-NOT transcriptional regulation complex NOT5 subunit